MINNGLILGMIQQQSNNNNYTTTTLKMKKNKKTSTAAWIEILFLQKKKLNTNIFFLK